MNTRSPDEPKKNVSRKLRKRIESARDRQIARYRDVDVPFNAAIPGGHVADFVQFSTAGFEQFKQTIESSSLSTRSMDRLAKVSRTIADLEARDETEPEHVDEAVSFVVGGMLRDNF